MKILSVLIFLLCCISPGAATTAGEMTEESNKESGYLSLDSSYFDFGAIPVDTIVEGEIGFKNTGTAPLVIFSIFSDCGCTAATTVKDPIPPGETGIINFKFNSKGRLPGAFRKTLRIRSNGASPRTNLVLRGTVTK